MCIDFRKCNVCQVEKKKKVNRFLNPMKVCCEFYCILQVLFPGFKKKKAEINSTVIKQIVGYIQAHKPYFCVSPETSTGWKNKKKSTNNRAV